MGGRLQDLQLGRDLATYRKEGVADLPHHDERRFKAFSLGTLGGHIRVADWTDFRCEHPHLRRYVEDWTEKLEAARAYGMLPYKRQGKVHAEEQNQGRWRTVVKMLLPQQQHEGPLQWINSSATGHYGFYTMKNALMLTTEDRRMPDSLKAMDRLKWTNGMLKDQAIDQRTTAHEVFHIITEKMMLHHRNEAQHQGRGGQRNW